MKIVFALLCTAFVVPKNSFAWGRKGHSLVAEVAFHYLDESTKKNVIKYLDGKTIEDEASWMDDIRSNHFYDYMKPYHYINIEKDEVYNTDSKNNIVSELTKVVKELDNINTLTDDNIKSDLLELFHLTGDLHQPLHDGYGIDKGGNKTQVSFMGKGSNIHSVWDSEIIEFEKISLEDCIQQYHYTNTELLVLQNIDVASWMNESRSNLAAVYNFSANKIDAAYADANKIVIEKQILLAGLRLAAVLEHSFKHFNRTPVFTKENTIIPTISIDSVAAYENKMVKVCTKVYGTKFLSDSKGQPTFLNAGAAFPNALLTILIWGNNREHFKNSPEKYYDQKTICVTGNIIIYKGKPEIVVSKEEEIEVQ